MIIRADFQSGGHQDYGWLTLVTCDNYDKGMKEYLLRRMVRTVLISVIDE